MKLTLSLNDDLYEELSTIAKSSKLTLQDWISKRLQIFKSIPLDSRHIELHSADLNEIETLLDSGHLASSTALKEAIQRRTQANFGGVKITLTQPELIELARAAERNHRTQEEELTARLKLVRPLMFHSAADVYADYNKV